MAVSLWAWSGAARAATLVVKPLEGRRAIQEALVQARSGDTVLVLPGSYLERLQLVSGVTLRSRDGAASTTLMGDLRAPVVTSLDSDTLTRLEGFTITKGGPGMLPPMRHPGGAGLLAIRSGIRVRDNRFVENQLPTGLGQGGAASLIESPALLERNTFENNSANDGGAVFARACSVLVLRGNRFTRNTADMGGGGLELDMHTVARVEHNIFDQNFAGYGGGVEIGPVTRVEFRNNTVVGNRGQNWGAGMFILSSRPLVTHNVFAENICDSRGGGLASGSNAFPDLRCNLGWHNTPDDFIAVEDSVEVAGLAGQRIADPEFCDFLRGNFHPRPGSAADREPCGTLGALPADCPRVERILR